MELSDMSREELFSQVSALTAEGERLTHKNKRLREVWQRANRMVQAAPIALILLDGKGKIKGANRAGAQILRAEGGAFRARPFSAFFFDRNEGRQFCELLGRDGRVADMEARLKNADGSARSVFLQAETEGLDGAGEACVAVYDLTHIRQMQGIMPELLRNGQLLYSQLPIGIFVTSPEGGAIAWNKALFDAMGYSEEELRSVNMFSLYVDRFDRIRLMEQAARDGTVRDFETKLYRKDGSEMTVLINTDLVEFGEEKRLFLTSFRDISAFRSAWDDLRLELGIMRAVRETTPALLLVLDREGTIVRFNRVCETVTGYSTGEVTGKPIWEVFPGDAAFARERVMELFDKKMTGSEENQLTAKDGEPVDVLWSFTMVRDYDGSARYLLASGNDITKRRQAESGLREANEKLRSWVGVLEERSREITRVTEMGEQLQSCENAWEACAIGAQYLRMLCPQSRGAIYLINSSRNLAEAAEMWGTPPDTMPVFPPHSCWALRRGRPTLRDTGHQGLLCEHITGAGEGKYLCVPLSGSGEELGLLYLSTGMDSAGEGRGDQGICLTSEHKYQLILTVADYIGLALTNLNLRETLRQQSIRDPLTGLFNRRYLEETIERELRREAREEKPIGFMMMDIDHFKEFNDTYGHDGGDALLRELGTVLKSITRGGDIVARYGGEEFVAILPDADLAETMRRAEELRARVSSLQVYHFGKLMRQCTISIGVSAFPIHGQSAEELIKKADTALYRAKRGGRNRVEAAGSGQ